mmetsp:Transcript_31844/g.49793  ORF Transcript_31844/g.49793 Transcript_31844/m.49793 type:complete len:145 (+) Transcript_31844:132-566(+)
MQEKAFCPAIFEYKGPMLSIREARCMSGNREYGDLFRAESHCICVQPWEYELDARTVAVFKHFMKMDDRALLSFTSTSPLAEGPSFVTNMRSILDLLTKYPRSKELFPDKRAEFRFGWKETQGWVELNDAPQPAGAGEEAVTGP